MSYSVNISGHIDGEPDEQRIAEEEIAAKTRDFVASLDGVSMATGHFQHLGQVDLKNSGE